MWFEIVLIVLCVTLAFLLDRSFKKREAAEAALECQKAQLEEVIQRFHAQGSLLRRWDRPTKHNKADEFYWLVKIASEDYLFTDEAIKVAVDRADKMRERGLLHD